MKKLLPLILLLIGSGAGVGAGIFLRPLPEPEAVEEHPAPAEEDQSTPKAMKAKAEGPEVGFDYVKMSNQFVVPLIESDRIQSMVVLSLSIEALPGKQDAIFLKEPKLRDSLLQVMFDHANIGGFRGEFTSAGTLDNLRRGLREAAQAVMGPDAVNDVLIVEIARQDY